MNDLQIILIIIGALIIAAVLLFNWWQERKFNQQVEKSFSQLQNDALLDEPSGEPIGLAMNNAANEFEDDNFSIDTERFKEHFDHDSDDRFVPLNTVSNQLPQDDLDDIDETYSSLVARHDHAQLSGSGLNNETDASAQIDHGNIANTKPAQHDEIKAIFNDVFSQPLSQTNAPTNTTHQPAPAVEQLEATVNVQRIPSIEPSTLVESKASESGVAESATGESATGESKIATINELNKSTLPAMLQSQMDLIAVIYLSNEMSISNLITSISGFFEDYSKPIHLHALVSHGDWVPLTASISETDIAQQNTSKITCSLQLADRAGAVTRSILNRFQLAVETLGLDINGHVEWQSNGDPLLAASALDAFCIEVDKTMGFHLVHGDHGAFTGTKLRGLCEAQGMVLESDGTFKYYQDTADEKTQNGTDAKAVSFVMFNRDNYPFNPEMLRTNVIKAVTFQLDIPHVMHCTEAFNHMVQVARQMEIGLHAVLVDDNNRPLGDMQIEKIRQQLKVIYATMLVRGVVPGSDSARRLFS